MESSKPVFALAFCCDQSMRLPLLVAATSAMRHLGAQLDLHVYLMLSSIDARGAADIGKVLDRVSRPYTLTILPPPNKAVFENLRPFYGSLAAYYRLLLPELIAEDRFLYLDTDTVTACDLSPLATIDMQGYPLGFVVEGAMGTAPEREFFLRLGHKADDPAFNSGVMLVDSKRWKAEQCFDRLMEFCRKYPRALLSADQTALNALFSKSCFRLDRRFNVRLATFVRDDLPAEAIYHFVGNPKPWDVLGELIHPYSKLWNEQRKAAGVGGFHACLEPSAWIRVPRIFGGYVRTLGWRLRYMR